MQYNLLRGIQQFRTSTIFALRYGFLTYSGLPMNMMMKFMKSSCQGWRKKRISHTMKPNILDHNSLDKHAKRTSIYTRIAPSKAFGIREANIRNSMTSSTKCSGIEANSLGQVEGNGILKPPTSRTSQTTIKR